MENVDVTIVVLPDRQTDTLVGLLDQRHNYFIFDCTPAGIPALRTLSRVGFKDCNRFR